MKKDLPQVYEFEDAVTYLKAFFDFKKAERSSFSLREFSRRVGVKSSGMFSMILSGKRSLTFDLAMKIVEKISLRPRERDFFLLLVKKSQASDSVERSRILSEILQIKSRLNKSIVDVKQFRFFSEWYYPVIYLLVGKSIERKRVRDLSKLLGRGVTDIQVNSALKDMVDLGLLEAHGDHYQQKNAHLATKDDIQQPAMFVFLSKMMDLAREAFELPSAKQAFPLVTWR